MRNGDRDGNHRLDDVESEAILARNQVGRLAYDDGTRITVEPMQYVYVDGWIYARTSGSARLKRVAGEWAPVRFEVDEVDGSQRWRSVIVRGDFSVAEVGTARWLPLDWADAPVGRLRVDQLDAPAPSREVVFRISVDRVLGNEIGPASSSPVDG